MISSVPVSSSHLDPVVLLVDSDFVFLPVDGGFRVATRGNTLQDGRLSSGHYHVRRVLSEIIT